MEERKNLSVLDRVINAAAKVKQLKDQKPRTQNDTYMKIHKNKYYEAKVNLDEALKAYVVDVIDAVFSDDKDRRKDKPVDDTPGKDKKDKDKDKKDNDSDETDLFN